ERRCSEAEIFVDFVPAGKPLLQNAARCARRPFVGGSGAPCQTTWSLAPSAFDAAWEGMSKRDAADRLHPGTDSPTLARASRSSRRNDMQFMTIVDLTPTATCRTHSQPERRAA